MSYRRSLEDERRLKKTYEETKNRYGPGVWYSEDKKRYIRSDYTSKFLKKQNSKITRRKLKNKDYILKGNKYKKLHDYWWHLL